MAQQDESSESKTVTTKLSVWGQCTYRNYVLVTICFPFDNSSPHSGSAAVNHIQASIRHLQRARPDFAAGLRLGADDGLIYLEKTDDMQIPFKVVDFPMELYTTYDKLRTDGFPLRALWHPSFSIDSELSPSDLKPVSQVRVSLINGGLILFVHIHHTFADGGGIAMFLDCFASCTRNDQVRDLPRDSSTAPLKSEAKNFSIQASQNAGRANTFDALLALTPEYIRHPFKIPLNPSTLPWLQRAAPC